ncbi:protein MLP1 homolog [Cynara cardunculus var. scolymus]|uniref:protein MLP1 homolog n=1 Tax=Cynara cardunculus var. scolymus TaxID=59895 RepID=UPI000D629748|nr:protein MLP1 homolog [Cynara cardunculus var. scolymus]
MAWLRTAMNKAAEVRGRSSLRAAVRSHGGNVVSGDAKKVQDRGGAQNMKNYKEAIRKLEEVSVSSNGEERVQLLRRWLEELRKIERLNAGSAENDEKNAEKPHTSSDENDSLQKSDIVLYSDPDLGVSPVNFRDVFLHSLALEGMTMSMILGAPNEEEISLLHELFRLCLTRGEEVHDVTVKRILDLSKAFSVYDDEVLAKRRELLQFAQDAIAGLKVNADILRIDSEVSEIHQKLKRIERQEFSIESDGSSLDATSDRTLEVIKESVSPIRLCCRLESLLLKKRLLNNGDTPEAHARKVDKLKVLSESLLSSASKTEKRISDHRQQKEEALHFRVAKTSEISQIEKDLEAEISVLEQERDKLEAELKKVKSSLAVATIQLQNAREEREQFDDASNELLVHFKAKEDELTKAIVSYKAEADTCSAFVNFLEATWAFQSSFMEQKEKVVNDELEIHEEYFVNTARSLLSAYKDALEPAITNLKKHMKNLQRYEKSVDPDDEFLQDIELRKRLEQAYLAAEDKIITIFDAVESVREQFYSAIDNYSRKDVEPVNELCDAIENIKNGFQSLARPTLRSDKPTQGEQASSKESPRKASSPKRALAVDLKSIFGQKLVARSPKNKPYIPLGGSCENSPHLNDDTKPVERELEKEQVRGDENSSHPNKEPSTLASESERENIEHSTLDVGGNCDKNKTDEGKLLQPSASVKERSLGVDKALVDLNKDLEKESREQLAVDNGRNMDITESQESNMGRVSTSEDEKFLEPTQDLGEKESVNPETTESEQGKTSQLSSSNGERSLDPDNGMPILPKESTEVSGNTKEQEISQSSSTSESDKLTDSDDEPEKSV